MLVCSFVNVTTAFVTTAPEASSTVPTITPLTTCAGAMFTTSHAITESRSNSGRSIFHLLVWTDYNRNAASTQGRLAALGPDATIESRLKLHLVLNQRSVGRRSCTIAGG